MWQYEGIRHYKNVAISEMQSHQMKANITLWERQYRVWCRSPKIKESVLQDNNKNKQKRIFQKKTSWQVLKKKKKKFLKAGEEG